MPMFSKTLFQPLSEDIYKWQKYYWGVRMKIIHFFENNYLVWYLKIDGN